MNFLQRFIGGGESEDSIISPNRRREIIESHRKHSKKLVEEMLKKVLCPSLGVDEAELKKQSNYTRLVELLIFYGTHNLAPTIVEALSSYDISIEYKNELEQRKMTYIYLPNDIVDIATRWFGGISSEETHAMASGIQPDMNRQIENIIDYLHAIVDPKLQNR